MSPAGHRLAERNGFVVAAAVLDLGFAAFLAVARYANEQGPVRAAEGPLASLAFLALLGSPGLLALLALRRRSALLLAAGVAMTPLAFFSMAGVTLPLLVPAGMCLAAFGARARPGPRPRVPAVVVAVAFLAMAVLAVVAVYSGPDQLHYQIGDSGYGSTSDYVTPREALASVALLGLGVAAATALATPCEPAA